MKALVPVCIVGNNEVALTETAREFNIIMWVCTCKGGLRYITRKILMLEHLSGWQRAYEGTF